MSTSVDPTAGDLVPLRDRLRIMQAIRLGLGLFVVVLVEVLDIPLNVSSAELLAATVSYLLVMAAAEAIWRLAHRRGLLLFGAMLITDGVYLAWAAYATGGSASPLRLIVMLHLIAVALVASHRTALKLALWHSMLLFVVHYAQEGGVLAQDGQVAAGLAPFSQLAVFVVVFWLVAAGTSTLAAANERELRRRRYDLEALSTMAARLEETRTLEEGGQIVVDSVVDTFGFSRGVLLDVVDGDGRLRLLAASGRHHATDEQHLPSASSILHARDKEHSSRLVTGLDPRADSWLAGLLPRATNLVVVPLHADGASTGMLVCEHGMRTGSRIERRVVSMLERFASHGALALNNAQLVERLRRVADTDGLTGIANRRTLDRVLTTEVARSLRTGRPLSAVLFDIDHFKRLNDTHGHQTGDEVLRQVAALLAGSIRATDTVARYGGEEFAVVLPDCTASEALVRADELRALIGRDGAPVPVTVSGGVAELSGAANDPASLIGLADQALYRSKHEGRDRVTVAAAAARYVEPAGSALPVRPG